MSSFVTITLDTTPPQDVEAEINGGDPYTTDLEVTLATTTSDADTTGYQMLVWGDVDETFDPNIQTDEGDSTWFAYSASLAVKLAAEGTQTLNVKLRDDVHNATSGTASDSIVYDAAAPTVTVMDGPDPARISKQPTKDESVIVWQVDQQYDEYKVKVVPNGSSPHTAGTVIGDSGGSINVADSTPNQPATTNVTTTITGDDLEDAAGADGDWVVKVFAKDDSGIWSL